MYNEHMSREDPQMKIRLPAELKERIEAEAKANGRSMNAQIVFMLERYFFLSYVEDFQEKEREREDNLVLTPDDKLPVGARIQKDFHILSQSLLHDLMVKHGLFKEGEMPDGTEVAIKSAKERKASRAEKK